MSRIANNPIVVPQNVNLNIDGKSFLIKGSKGELSYQIHESVDFSFDDNTLKFSWDDKDKKAKSQAGTSRAILNNMIQGVANGFEKKLALVGVGYRAQVKGKVLNMTLGFSHPIDFPIPEGITIETPSPTEIIIKGIDKQKIGQVSAKIRSFRPPEPYKGKGVRYADEYIARKEAKKK